MCGSEPRERMMSCLLQIPPVRETPLCCMFTSDRLWPRTIAAARCKKSGNSRNVLFVSDCTGNANIIYIAVRPCCCTPLSFCVPATSFTIRYKQASAVINLTSLIIENLISNPHSIIHDRQFVQFVAADICLKPISDTPTGNGSIKLKKRQQTRVLV